MIANSDQFIDYDINQYLALHNQDFDGFIMTMKAEEDKWREIKTVRKDTVLSFLDN